MSILTTTGFTTADYELWPQAAQMFLYAACFIGACAGSTTSGIKVVHYVIIWKYMVASIKKIFFQPMSVISIRLNGRPVERIIIDLAICYFIVNIFLVLAGRLFHGPGGRYGLCHRHEFRHCHAHEYRPGIRGGGPSENYAHISDVGKWFLSYMMLVGRLEMFSALVIFYPSFWKR